MPYDRAHKLKLHARSGQLGRCGIRSVCWKFFLGLFPLGPTDEEFFLVEGEGDVSRWVHAITAARNNYQDLQAQHLISSRQVAEKLAKAMGGEVEDDNDSEGGKAQETWRGFYANKDVEDQIRKDVLRTQGGMDFFKRQEVQDMMLRILLVWARSHPNVSYKQGMSELLAVTVYLLYIEQWPEEIPLTPDVRQIPEGVEKGNDALGKGETKGGNTTKEEPLPSKSLDAMSILPHLTDGNYLEHDAFAMLSRMMNRISSLYAPAEGRHRNPSNNSSNCGKQEVKSAITTLTDSSYRDESFSSTGSGFHDEGADAGASDDSMTDADTSSSDHARGSTNGSFLLHKLERIQGEMLRDLDEDLSLHLSQLGVEAHMYLLRWVRLLLSREFPMVQVWLLWDAVFALTPDDFSLVDHLCAAMVHHLRPRLIAETECHAALKHLLNFPQMVDLNGIISTAVHMYDGD